MLMVVRLNLRKNIFSIPFLLIPTHSCLGLLLLLLPEPHLLWVLSLLLLLLPVLLLWVRLRLLLRLRLDPMARATVQMRM
jgi:hypothetical protein